MNVWHDASLNKTYQTGAIQSFFSQKIQNHKFPITRTILSIWIFDETGFTLVDMDKLTWAGKVSV